MKKLLSIVIIGSAFCLGCEKEINRSYPLDDGNKMLKSTEDEVEGDVIEWEQEGEGTYYFDEINTYSEFQVRRFDIYSPPSEEPVPLIIAFHGGGFASGHRSEMYPAVFNSAPRNFPWITIANLNNRKIAYAAVSYAIAQNDNNINIQDALEDCRSYVDFFSDPVKAALYNVDPNRIILMGFSAGASASLWIGLQNIYPNIKGMVCFDPQASLDTGKWETTIFNSDPALIAYCQNEMSKPAFQALTGLVYRNGTTIDYPNLHLVDLIDADDPEVYLVSYNNIDPNLDFLHSDPHIHKLITRSINTGHNKMKFMFDVNGNYWGYQYPNPETIINFCDRLF